MCSLWLHLRKCYQDVVKLISSFKNMIELLQLFMEKPTRYLQALAGELLHFLEIKANSVLPLISKAMGRSLRWVIKMFLLLFPSKELSTWTTWSWIWIILPWFWWHLKETSMQQSLFFGVAPPRTREDCSEKLRDWTWKMSVNLILASCQTFFSNQRLTKCSEKSKSCLTSGMEIRNTKKC